MNLKKILSYILPINIYQTPSEINKNIEVTWNNGQLVLDSKNTNFSFGSLERVLRVGLNQIGREKIKKYQSALILGVAGGSVIKLLQKEFYFSGKITGIELDAKIIEVANRYFELNKINKLEIVIQDAETFVYTTTKQFDLIVIDVFQDKIMPNFLFDSLFVKKLKNILTEKGSILFNTITTLSTDYERNSKYYQLVSQHFYVRKLSNIEGDNELFLLKLNDEVVSF